jgi:hypothetical protein
MAVLAAQRNASGGQAIRSVSQIVDRVVWGRRQRNEDSQRALEVLSLFEWVGLTGRVAEESLFIAEKLAGMPHAAFVERVKSFIPRGVVAQRWCSSDSNPAPATLGANRLSSCLKTDLRFSLGSSGQISESWRIDGSILPRGEAFARPLLGTNYAKQFLRAQYRFGAESGSSVHVAPDLVMAMIQNVFGDLTDQELLG